MFLPKRAPNSRKLTRIKFAGESFPSKPYPCFGDNFQVRRQNHGPVYPLRNWFVPRKKESSRRIYRTFYKTDKRDRTSSRANGTCYKTGKERNQFREWVSSLVWIQIRNCQTSWPRTEPATREPVKVKFKTGSTIKLASSLFLYPGLGGNQGQEQSFFQMKDSFYITFLSY